MNIEYKSDAVLSGKNLEELFLSVNWSSGAYPEKLEIAMKNYKTVFSAWDNDKLIGLICIMDDGIMNAYVHYLLVNPEYQGNGIGKHLTHLTTEKYKNYLRIVIVAYNEKIDFYKSCGFKLADDSSPMFITSLWT